MLTGLLTGFVFQVGPQQKPEFAGKPCSNQGVLSALSTGAEALTTRGAHLVGVVTFPVLLSGATNSRWWFQIFFIFTPKRNDPISLIFFKWVETTN